MGAVVVDDGDQLIETGIPSCRCFELICSDQNTCFCRIVHEEIVVVIVRCKMFHDGLYRVKGDFNFFRISSCGTFRGLPGRALGAPPCNAPCAGAGAASPDEDEEELEELLESLSSSDAIAGTLSQKRQAMFWT